MSRRDDWRPWVRQMVPFLAFLAVGYALVAVPFVVVEGGRAIRAWWRRRPRS